MRLSIDLGLTHFSLHVGRVFAFEVDLHGILFVRVWGIGQVWLQRGMSSFDSWAVTKSDPFPCSC